jgi:hypothetical protein
VVVAVAVVAVAAAVEIAVYVETLVFEMAAIVDHF